MTLDLEAIKERYTDRPGKVIAWLLMEHGRQDVAALVAEVERLREGWRILAQADPVYG